MIETVLYIVLLVFVMGVIVQTLVAMTGVYRNIKLTHELESSGTIAMESMLREIRNASHVAVSGSILSSSLGQLSISGTDQSGISYVITFDVSAGTIRISKDGSEPVALTSLSGTVTYLAFTHLINPNSEAVRIELQMSGTAGAAAKTERFYGFTVLRGSY